MKACLLLLFSFLLWGPANSQSLEQTFLLAKKQEDLQQYQQAVSTYQRVLYFDKAGVFQSDSYQHIASCYFMQQNFEKAAEYFDLTYNLSTDENVKTELIYKKTSCLLLSHNYKYALVELLNLSENTTGQLSRRRNFYLGMTYFGMNNFKEAEKAFIASIDSLNHQKEQLKIREIFIAVKKVDRINPKTAKILSVLIPGLGQIYAGDIRNGLNSLAITSAFVYMAYAISIKSTYIDGILTAMPWYQRYYMGGYARAEKITIARKNEKFNRCYERILDSIIETLD